MELQLTLTHNSNNNIMKKFILFGVIMFSFSILNAFGQNNMTNVDTLIVDTKKDMIGLVISPSFVDIVKNDTTGEYGGELYYDLLYYNKELKKDAKYKSLINLYKSDTIRIDSVTVKVDNYTYVFSRNGNVYIGKMISSASIKQAFDRLHN